MANEKPGSGGQDAKKDTPLVTILKPEDDIKWEEKVARETASINIALIPDPAGPIKHVVPTMRDPETHKQMYMDVRFKPINVPPDEVLFYTGSPIIDFHATHSDTVSIQGKRTVVVFDRTYTYKDRVIPQCAWVPDKAVRAGILFGKMIDQRTKQPFGVMKKLGDGKTPMFQIVGGKETDYRDLKRIFERVFIKGEGPKIDDGLDQFMHSALGPIPEEVQKQ
jgi:hypothetical protein